MPHLAHIALLVRDYDEALAFYVGKLGFELVENSCQPEQDKRWVTIRPPHAPAGAAAILLARAATPEQQRFVGDQAGGRVFCSSRPTISTATTRPIGRPGSRSSVRPRCSPMASRGVPRSLRQSLGPDRVRARPPQRDLTPPLAGLRHPFMVPCVLAA